MRLDLLDPDQRGSVWVEDTSGGLRPRDEIMAEIERLPGHWAVHLESREPLGPIPATTLFRALATGARRPLYARLTPTAIRHKGALDEAARAGCVAIELCREEVLVRGLASLLPPSDEEMRNLLVALRRARGLGIATVARLSLGMPGDDEGVFDRALRFCRRALIAVPLIEVYPHAKDAEPMPAGSPSDAWMNERSLDNGLSWLRTKLGRHRAIWRRALWPTGNRRMVLAAGYQLRRDSVSLGEGTYTPTMRLLRLLNRNRRARRATRMLSTLEHTVLAPPAAAAPARPWLRTRAWSNGRLGTLFIRVEGSLDLAGARSLLRQVRQACAAGFAGVTIDFHGLESVSHDVVTRFLAENRARLLELASFARLCNLRGVVESLRSQLGDTESIRWLESALLQAGSPA
jgi:anti-anti-sigma regulatory factor